jgi:hypothetical protein
MLQFGTIEHYCIIAPDGSLEAAQFFRKRQPEVYNKLNCSFLVSHRHFSGCGHHNAGRQHFWSCFPEPWFEQGWPNCHYCSFLLL